LFTIYTKIPVFPKWKITGINDLLEKVVLFDRLERFEGFISFHLHFFWVAASWDHQPFLFDMKNDSE
jgi:hypothetical protein